MNIKTIILPHVLRSPSLRQPWLHIRGHQRHSTCRPKILESLVIVENLISKTKTRQGVYSNPASISSTTINASATVRYLADLAAGIEFLLIVMAVIHHPIDTPAKTKEIATHGRITNSCSVRSSFVHSPTALLTRSASGLLSSSKQPGIHIIPTNKNVLTLAMLRSSLSRERNFIVWRSDAG